jgi:DNA-binding helix-hairpin-helix protein with protein kinase domain
MAALSLRGSIGRVALGRELGRGAEGAVFEVAGHAELVAKVYHSPVSPEKGQKLQVMAKLATADLLTLTAWPVDVLQGHDGRVQGLLMPKVDGSKDIHALYGPKSRRAEFPDATWRHLIRAATNVARAFAVLHEMGCVIGDVNHGSIRVRRDMTVKLIDCDSFQLQASGRTFYCEVGVENFTPPELQGRPFKGVLRTSNHDNFGLAVMVFYLLMLGRHPFAGRYSGRGEMPIEKAITEHRYAYGRNAKAASMDPPPFAPAALAASAEIAELWERAFSPQGAQGVGRPTAREWIGRLKALESSATRCAQHPGHYFVAASGRCPWCAIESSSGTLLFLAPLGAIVTDSHFNLAVVWSRIAQIAPPGPVPEIPVPTVKPSPQASALRASCLARKIGGRVAVLIAACIALAVAPGGFILWLLAALALWAGVGSWAKAEAEVSSFRNKRNEAHGLFMQFEERLRTETAPERFAQRLKALETMRVEYMNLPIVRDRKMKALIADREKHARTRFLEGFEIEDAKIPGIGPAKRAMLESYNIETAADITESAVLDVPGFGPALYGRLADWRRSVDMRFKFDPNSAVDPRDIQDLERNLVQRRMQLERSLLQGGQELERLRQEFARLREQLLKSAAPYAISFAQAEADWNALND